MNIIIILLRVLHIFGGIFWVGFAFVNLGFLQPTIRATGQEGQKVQQHLMGRTRLMFLVYSAATITMLSGLFLYWILSGFRAQFFMTSYGVVLTVGSIAGIIAWTMAVFVMRNILGQVAGLGQAIQAGGGPPSEEQSAQLQALRMKISRLGSVTVGFMILAVLGMAMAQYLSF